MEKSWDEPLSEGLVTEWNDIAQNTCEASSLRLDRFISRASGEVSQLLVFYDASTKVYATVVYLRTKCGEKYHNNLLFCKASIVPVGKSKNTRFKHLTIEKMWMCLFTCLSVRAIHLELVRGLPAQQLLDHLRRYIARRGYQMVISDNAPQFRLVKTVLDNQWNEVFKDDVLSFFANLEAYYRFGFLARWLLRMIGGFGETSTKERYWS